MKSEKCKSYAAKWWKSQTMKSNHRDLWWAMGGGGVRCHRQPRVAACVLQYKGWRGGGRGGGGWRWLVEVEHELRSRATRDASLVPRLTDVSPSKLPRSCPPLVCRPTPAPSSTSARRVPDGLSGAPERGKPGHPEEGERESEEEAGGGAGQAQRRGA